MLTWILKLKTSAPCPNPAETVELQCNERVLGICLSNVVLKETKQIHATTVSQYVQAHILKITHFHESEQWVVIRIEGDGKGFIHKCMGQSDAHYAACNQIKQNALNSCAQL